MTTTRRPAFPSIGLLTSLIVEVEVYWEPVDGGYTVEQVYKPGEDIPVPIEGAWLAASRCTTFGPLDSGDE